MINTSTFVRSMLKKKKKNRRLPAGSIFLLIFRKYVDIDIFMFKHFECKQVIILMNSNSVDALYIT